MSSACEATSLEAGERRFGIEELSVMERERNAGGWALSSSRRTSRESLDAGFFASPDSKETPQR
jgi:hypothetical protein